MRTSWMGAMVATVVAAALIGAGLAFATPPEDRGRPAGKGPQGPHDDGPGGGSGKGKGRPDGTGKGGGGKGCDVAASSAIQAFVDIECPCDGVDDGAGGTVAWKNHGRYVRCVARAVKAAAREAGVKRRCVRSLVPCAAWSTCGKRNAVTCVVPTLGACVDGLCDGDADAPCTTDVDCASSTCSVTNAEDCAAAGGTAGSGSCCAASPSGAFVE